MEDIELGWLAGIVDGEGSIGLVKSKEHPYLGVDGNIIEKTFDVFPYVSVTDTSIELLSKFRELCIKLLSENSNENIKVPKISKVLSKNKNHKDVYRFGLNRSELIKKFLSSIVLLLTAKKFEAEYMLKFVDFYPDRTNYLGRCSFYEKWQEAKRNHSKP